jgi:hypothetical protein
VCPTREERGSMRCVLDRVGERQQLALVVCDMRRPEHLRDPHRGKRRHARAQVADRVSGTARGAALLLGGVVAAALAAIIARHPRDQNRDARAAVVRGVDLP